MKFIVTNELGKLARWLRIAGFDTLYYSQEGKGALVIHALRDGRIIITRTKEKIANSQKKTIIVTRDDVKEQLKEVIAQLNLKIEEEKMFTRCTLCNEGLVGVAKEEIKGAIPPRVYAGQEVFKKCSSCGKVYWQGSHWRNVSRGIKELTTDDHR